MPKLYTMPGTCSLAPNIAVQWAGADVEIANLAYGDHKKEPYLGINPQGRVPALQFEDGRVLTEASAILGYLAETAPAGDLTPRNELERARNAEALSYMSSEVHADYGPHFSPKKFAESKTAQDEVKQAAYRKLNDHYTRLDANLQASGGDWYLGRRGTADAFLYVLTRWIELTPLSIADYPDLKTFRDKMQADDGVQAALQVQNMEAV